MANIKTDTEKFKWHKKYEDHIRYVLLKSNTQMRLMHNILTGNQC